MVAAESSATAPRSFNSLFVPIIAVLSIIGKTFFIAEHGVLQQVKASKAYHTVYLCLCLHDVCIPIAP